MHLSKRKAPKFMPWSDKDYQREYIKKWRKDRRDQLRAEVNAIRAQTVCIVCGGQPIDFHRKEHIEHPQWRICNLLKRAAPLATILAEITHCTPFCRRHHLIRDGRIENLRQQGEGHWNSRLTLADVGTIRESSKSNQELAAEFGVTTRQIRKIRNMTQWRT